MTGGGGRPARPGQEGGISASCALTALLARAAAPRGRGSPPWRCSPRSSRRGRVRRRPPPASDKGWVYWQLLQLADLGQGAAWAADARAFALHLAAAVDPATGVAHGPLSASTAEAAASCPDGYRVDHDVESGLALVDAGVRFATPQWRAVGAREVDVVTAQSFDAGHHLYDRIVCQGAVWDAHAKLGEQADEIVALLSVGAAAAVPADTARAEQMLDELAGAAGGLHDTVQRTAARAPGGQAPWPLVAVLAALGATGAAAVAVALRRRRATGR